MTWIVDENGRRWVEPQARVKRKRGRGRFADVKVGDQLMCRVISRWDSPIRDDLAANDAGWQRHERDHGFQYAIVTDLWFDPVAGQDDPLKGEMVGIQILHQGRPRGGKRAHTIRGLASNKWQYADRDEIAHWEAVRAGVDAGDVIGIGRGRRDRKEPRLYRL
ncbi:hypothetical protein MRBLMC3_000808 [Sphingobium sp. LMC3-1-1.1]|uniref:hypothetical protein n=1 Tax=Sphingobium sp. LMC3-1-1.1 TaxID=3135241 RepID=UPI00341F58CE